MTNDKNHLNIMNGAKNVSVNKKNTVLVRFLIGIIALFLFVIFLNLFSPQIKNYFHLLSYPVEKNFWQAGQSTSEFLGSILNSRDIVKENESLKNENQKLLSQVTFLQAARRANKAQSDISVARQNSEFEFIMAGVIGLDSQDELTINRGSDDGILEGMPVINQQNALFGKVVKVYKNFSKVMLISNKNSVANVKVQQNKNDDSPIEIYGVIKGDGGLGAYLDLVPVDDTLNQEDVLVTSVLEGTFPKDLLVGKISKIEKNDQNPHQQAQVQLFLNIRTDNLFVITNYKRSD